MGRSRCAPASRVASGLAVFVILAASICDVSGAGVFSAREDNSDEWRAEVSRLLSDSRFSERRAPSGGNARRRVLEVTDQDHQAAWQEGQGSAQPGNNQDLMRFETIPLTDPVFRRQKDAGDSSDSSGDSSEGGSHPPSRDSSDSLAAPDDSASSDSSARRPKTPVTSKSDIDCIPQPMPPCPPPPPPPMLYPSSSTQSSSSGDKNQQSSAGGVPPEDCDLVFFLGELCCKDFDTLSGMIQRHGSSSDGGQAPAPAPPPGPPPMVDITAEYPLCSDIVNGVHVVPRKRSSPRYPPHLPPCPPPINPACPDYRPSSSDGHSGGDISNDNSSSDGAHSSNGSSGGTSGGTSNSARSSNGSSGGTSGGHSGVPHSSNGSSGGTSGGTSDSAHSSNGSSGGTSGGTSNSARSSNGSSGGTSGGHSGGPHSSNGSSGGTSGGTSDSARSSNGSSGGTSGGTSGSGDATPAPTPGSERSSSETNATTPAPTPGVDSSSSGGEGGCSSSVCSSDGNSSSNGTQPTPGPTGEPEKPNNSTYGTQICLDGNAIDRNTEYTLVVSERDYPGINNCDQLEEVPSQFTLIYMEGVNENSLIIPVVQECDQNGRYFIFESDRAGVLQISISVPGNSVDGSCPVNGAEINADTCTASGPGISVGFLDEPNEVIICCEDVEGSPVYDDSLLVAPTLNLTYFLSPVDVITNVTKSLRIPDRFGCVNFFYTPIALRPIGISIYWNFTHITDSPFSVMVQEVNPAFDFSKYTATGPGTDGQAVDANTTYTIKLQPRDSESNAIRDNGYYLPILQGDGVIISINYGVDRVEYLPHVVVYDEFGGAYFITYNTTRPGYLSIEIEARGTPAQGSPYVSVINGAAITAQTICAAGIGTQEATALMNNVINIRARDVQGFEVYNDLLIIEGLSITATDETGVTADSIFLEPVNGLPGRYRLNYFPTQAGQFTMTIQWQFQNIVGCGIYSSSPYRITVTEPAPSARMSTMTADAEAKNFVGEASLAPVAARLEGPELMEGHVNIDLNFSPLTGYGEGRVPAPVDVKFERMEEDHNMIYTLRYMPSLPGSYSIDVKVDDEVVDTLHATVSPAAPPQMTSAQFEDSLAALRIMFDKKTNKANMVGLGECSQVLDERTVRQLGVGAQCVWRDARQLMVHMSPDYTLRPGSEVAVRPLALHGELENDEPASGGTQVTNAANPIPLTAVLTGPSVVGPCDRLYLSALDTRGAGSGAIKYSWMVLAAESIDTNLTGIKDLLAAHDSATLELAPGVLPPGHKYVFSVRVTSIWGLRDTASMTVYSEHSPETPAVTVFGPTIDHIDSSEPYYLEGGAQTASTRCADGGNSLTEGEDSLKFMWTVKPEIFFHPTMLKALENPKLKVPQGLMFPGRSYIWTLTASAKDGRTASASKVINTILPPIDVEGALGPNRAASFRSNLYLTANPSDPLEDMVRFWQEEGTSMEPWIYKWSCQQRCWAGNSDCDPAVEGEPCGNMGLAGQKDETAVVLAGAMEEGYRYLFQALISREPFFDRSGELQPGRVRIASVIIDAVDSRGSPVLNVAIRGRASGSSINAHEPLVLECVSAPAAGAVLWELKQGDLPRGYRLSDVAVSNGGLSSVGQRRLVIPPHTFTPGQEVELGCSAVSLDGRSSGQARLPLYVRQVPSGGTLKLSARSSPEQPWRLLNPSQPFEMAEAGISLVDSNRDGISDTFVGDFEELGTVIKAVAVGWTSTNRQVLGNDMQPAFQYQFFYRLGDGTRASLTSSQASSIAEVILPAGMVVLEVDVIGPGGATATYSHPLSILISEQTPEPPRHLLASTVGGLPALTAAQGGLYKQFVREQKLDNVLQFVRIWSTKACLQGAEESQEENKECSRYSNRATITKATMAADLGKLDEGQSLSTEYVEQMACSAAMLTCDPAQVSPEAHGSLVRVMDSVLLQAVLTREEISLRNAKACYEVMLDGLWLSSQRNCGGADANTVQSQKHKLSKMTEHVGMALAQDNVPGALQLDSSGLVLDIATAHILQGPPQILLPVGGLNYRVRVAGLPADSEVCMAAWVYKTSGSALFPNHVDPLLPPDYRLDGVGSAFGFAAAVNCSAPLTSVSAVVSLSQELVVPERGSTLLGCWAGNEYTYVQLTEARGGLPEGTLATNIPSSAPSGLCGWFGERLAPDGTTPGGHVPALEALSVDGGEGDDGGRLGIWIILVVSTVVLAVLAALAVFAIVLMRRRRRAREDADALQQRAMLAAMHSSVFASVPGPPTASPPAPGSPTVAVEPAQF